MSPASSFHSQLASIMEVLANTAVAEICELVDSGYAVLQLEISRSRKENEVLRRKLRLMELRAARSAALRAAASGSGSAPFYASGGRTRVNQRVHEQRRHAPPTGVGEELSLPSNEQTSLSRDTCPPSEPVQEAAEQTPAAAEMSTVIKLEDEDEPWSQPDPHSKPFTALSVRMVAVEFLRKKLKRRLRPRRSNRKQQIKETAAASPGRAGK
ncbi:PREDICTED: uncharacterized protein LOC107086995 [Cyprinodon variegatus]|uniref:uncharacterized protein LOC107086995 n=1 Tax=Cyprinodon variegatus TaxID=28743 RepID=UPI000742ADC2|nr:PREDICTED: uncharacterized protein LOC107086995 [Cyprinodon variegatus]